MTDLVYTYDGEQVRFSTKAPSPGFFTRIMGTRTPSPDINGWAAGAAARCDGLGALRQYGEEHAGTVQVEADRIAASHAAVATLTAGQARSLGLPGHPPFPLVADTRGVIGSSGFELRTRWMESGRPVTARRRGAFLESGKGVFLIPDPQFSLVELADAFEAGSVAPPEHWNALARFRHLLGSAPESPDAVSMSEFLRGLRIYSGTALSLQLKGSPENPDFDPVLFGTSTARTGDDEDRPPSESDVPISESDEFLGQELLAAFQSDSRTGFRSFETAKRSYLLGPKTCLIVDDDLETALQVVREKQQAAPAERRAFAANPRAAIADRLAATARSPSAEMDGDVLDEDIEERVASLFVETPEYADRAIGLGIWQAPAIEFVARPTNEWLPEAFSVDLGGVQIQLTPDAAAPLQESIDAAIEAGESEVRYQGQPIPATPEVSEKLAGIVEAAATDDPEDSDSPDTAVAPVKGAPDRTVIIVHENFVEENWSPRIPERESRPPEGDEVPKSVRTELLDHQREALQWQIAGWCAGLPGLLNADDQGLGKTLQTLAFLAWLKAWMSRAPESRRKPILVVAPTGLLRTWEDEADKHLAGTGLGACVKAYGSNLKALRAPGLAGRDTDDGKPRLRFGDLHAAFKEGLGHGWWVLTTYETLTNYQHSFREIPFAVVVFDEIQKIKNTATLMALAARGIRADFRIGLTGTPIENYVGDLWSVMDAVVPGRLDTLKQFLQHYQEVTENNMRELHARVFHSVESGGVRYPPSGQRRLKEEVLEDLPRKDYRIYPAIMHPAQEAVYEQARASLAVGDRGAGLRMLHHIRGASLHPESPDAEQGAPDSYLARSARLDSVRRILLRLQARGERVLLFTEHRRMQAFVAQWIRSEFGLDRVPIINGATPITKRKKIVTDFQDHLASDGGFDVLILSPRAAGVGLTLTAATHVIHLSRWWNPAVEEQCNDRIYRIGQERDVTIHLPFAIHTDYRERSFDCVLNDLMRRKRSLARAALWPPVLSGADQQALMRGICDGEVLDPGVVDGHSEESFVRWVADRAQKSGDWQRAEGYVSADGALLLRNRRRQGDCALVWARHTDRIDHPVGEAEIQALLRATEPVREEHVQLVAVTNAAAFTDGADALAMENDVVLVDRVRLGLWPAHVLA